MRGRARRLRENMVNWLIFFGRNETPSLFLVLVALWRSSSRFTPYSYRISSGFLQRMRPLLLLLSSFLCRPPADADGMSQQPILYEQENKTREEGARRARPLEQEEKRGERESNKIEDRRELTARGRASSRSPPLRALSSLLSPHLSSYPTLFLGVSHLRSFFWSSVLPPASPSLSSFLLSLPLHPPPLPSTPLPSSYPPFPPLPPFPPPPPWSGSPPASPAVAHPPRSSPRSSNSSRSPGGRRRSPLSARLQQQLAVLQPSPRTSRSCLAPSISTGTPGPRRTRPRGGGARAGERVGRGMEERETARASEEEDRQVERRKTKERRSEEHEREGYKGGKGRKEGSGRDWVGNTCCGCVCAAGRCDRCGSRLPIRPTSFLSPLATSARAGRSWPSWPSTGRRTHSMSSGSTAANVVRARLGGHPTSTPAEGRAGTLRLRTTAYARQPLRVRP